MKTGELGFSFSKICIIQGLPSGFDIMYLALGDRNLQVRFDLKVV